MTMLAACALLASCATTVSESCQIPAFEPRVSSLTGGDIDRLRRPPGNNEDRSELARIYLEQHCDDVRSFYIAGAGEENHSCLVRGASDHRIVIGAHYDKTRRGDGVVDNWTGVMLLARLLRALEGTTPQHTLEFVMFGAEEPGMLGSAAYLKAHPSPESIRAMINLDTFGTRAVAVDRRSTASLECLATQVATALGLEPRTTYLKETVGDWQTFSRRGIAVLNLNSLDRGTLRLIHTRRDTFDAVDPAVLEETWDLVFNVTIQADRHLGELVIPR